jgi:hypothetical protein
MSEGGYAPTQAFGPGTRNLPLEDCGGKARARTSAEQCNDETVADASWPMLTLSGDP